VAAPTLVTARLILRAWDDSDLEPFAHMNADPLVMEHFPSTLTRAESDALAARFVAEWESGVAHWVVEERGSGEFVGFEGFLVPRFSAHFTPAVEIGWRMNARFWGRGYATEAGETAMEWASENLDPPRGEIVSFTTVGNVRSRRVMERLGFRHDPADDFDHPSLPDWEFRRHVLYRRPL